MSDTSTNRFVGYGTAAERAAFTPSPATIAAAPKQLYIWYESDTGNIYAYDTSWHFVSGSTAASGPIIPAARLTTETGVPVSTSDRTAQGTIYWTPYNGNQIRLYSGSTWVQFTLTEKSLALTATSGKNYDVFAYDNAGTVTLELSAAWTDDTTRADALALQDGVYVKSGATTRLWIGTIRASGANVTSDSGGGTTTQVGAKRFVWNTFNQVPRQMSVIDTANTWSYATDTWRVADGATAPLNCIEWVTGIAASMLDATVLASANIFNNTATAAKVGVGIDSSSVPSGTRQEVFNAVAGAGVSSASIIVALGGSYRGLPGLGYHYASWLEKGATAGTCTFIGDNGADGSQSGLTAWMLS